MPPKQIPEVARTISGAPTSIAAFVGWANQGSVKEAPLIGSFAEFQNSFGGLNPNSYLGYAVSQFFSNGGQQAYIVRLVDSATAKTAQLKAGASGTLDLSAINPGAWGNSLSVSVAIQATNPARFNILVLFNGAIVEAFASLSVTPADLRYVVSSINNQSQYIRFANPENPTMPAATPSPVPFMGGNDGTVLKPGDGKFEEALNASAALKRMGDFNLLCVPGETEVATIAALEDFCFKKRALLLVDSPPNATIADLSANGPLGTKTRILTPLTGQHAENVAYYFPWVKAPDPLAAGASALFPPCGFVAGIYAATDASRGVWKAPAGEGATIAAATGLQYTLTDAESGLLDAKGINPLRQFPVYGNVVWGARTLQGNDQTMSEWKYIPVRRLALFLETSIYAGTKWAVFEPNNEALWAQIRLSVGSFLQNVFRQGAFQGTTPQQAYFVKCDAENNPQSRIANGTVNITVGFAPLAPAEFVVIQIAQLSADPHSRLASHGSVISGSVTKC